jgi:mRNA interferase YafQ
MFQIVITNKFKKDVKLIHKRGWDMELLKKVIEQFEDKGKLSRKIKPHKLTGDYSGYWEAHIKPDWLIIWKMLDNENEIWLVRTGTHSDLF